MSESIKETISEEIIFQLISYSGDARSLIYEAFNLVAQGKCEEAEEVLNRADESIIKAHNLQTKLIQDEASGKVHEINLLALHSQDHLMTTLLAKEIMGYMISMQKQINGLKEN
ncbi:PTS lactose/cellobiose transporter subunit IIA [Fonticella tunisiensis]|uniref:PTS system cellobiose-specific IIA component n=1 Tax=Fonticella tunisiensis TaxID=1096341 RepID=A0A4R7KBK3_9CLOT|nr:PTS lactose/cellobiose transporter subunit IIA [Fonticella tunisiensis]TDT51073.1 PTS system cellobiose-specific IIA component [Fonticella tunisiensis]